MYKNFTKKHCKYKYLWNIGVNVWYFGYICRTFVYKYLWPDKRWQMRHKIGADIQISFIFISRVRVHIYSHLFVWTFHGSSLRGPQYFEPAWRPNIKSLTNSMHDQNHIWHWAFCMHLRDLDQRQRIKWRPSNQSETSRKTNMHPFRPRLMEIWF